MAARLLEAFANERPSQVNDILGDFPRLAPTMALLRGVFEKREFNAAESDDEGGIDEDLSWERRLAQVLGRSRFVRNLVRNRQRMPAILEANDNDAVDIVGAFVTLDSVAA